MQHILVLSYVHEGGEWIATKRLIDATRRSPAKLRFSLIGLTDTAFTEQDPGFRFSSWVLSAHTSPPFSYFKNLWLNITAVRAAARKIVNRPESVDYFYCTDFLMVLSCFGVKNRHNIPIIFHFHGIRSVPFVSYGDINHREIITKILERLAYMLSSLIIVPAQTAIQTISSALPFAGRYKKIRVIPNLVPFEYFDNPSPKHLTAFKKRYGIPADHRIILYSGRISVRKGLENLLQSFARLHASENKLVLVFAYPGTSKDDSLLRQLKQSAGKIGVEGKVLFLEGLREDERVVLYHAADITVLASDIETAPLSMLESLASGTVFLGTKTGNMTDVLAQISPMLSLESGDPGEIYQKLRYWLDLPLMKRLQIRRKCKSVAMNYSAEKSVISFRRIFTDA